MFQSRADVPGLPGGAELARPDRLAVRIDPAVRCLAATVLRFFPPVAIGFERQQPVKLDLGFRLMTREHLHQ